MWFHIYKISKELKRTEKWLLRAGEWRDWCLMSTQFWFCKMKTFQRGLLDNNVNVCDIQYNQTIVMVGYGFQFDWSKRCQRPMQCISECLWSYFQGGLMCGAMAGRERLVLSVTGGIQWAGILGDKMQRKEVYMCQQDPAGPFYCVLLPLFTGHQTPAAEAFLCGPNISSSPGLQSWAQ